MKFRKSTAYQLLSDCALYSIAKVIVQGEVQYEAWYLPEKLPPIALGAREKSSLDCIGICRRHSEKRAQKTARGQAAKTAELEQAIRTGQPGKPSVDER